MQQKVNIVAPAIFLALCSTVWSYDDLQQSPLNIIWTDWKGCGHDCSPDCVPASPPNDYCTYRWYELAGFEKHCSCNCGITVDYTPCFKVEVEGRSSDGTYYLTKQVYQGKEVYSRMTDDPVYIHWTGVDWHSSHAVGGSAYASCGQARFSDCTSGLVVKSCSSLWRKDEKCGPNNPSDGFPLQPAFCNPDKPNRCCKLSSGTCGSDWDHCKGVGRVNAGMLNGDCVLEETSQPVDYCQITPLDLVDHEIGKQMAWNVLGALTGALPGGQLFDVLFAILDPIGPVTSEFTLADNIIKAVNTQIEALKVCMDQMITNSEVESMRIAFAESMRKAQYCGRCYDEEKRKCVDDVFLELHGQLVYFQTQQTGDLAYMAYEKILPNFQAIFPFWMVTLTSQLKYFQDANDACNFNAALVTGKEDTEIFVTWAEKWAMQTIVDQLTPDMRAYDESYCLHNQGGSDASYYTLGDWLSMDVDDWNCAWSPNERHCARAVISMRLTKQTKRTCKFTSEAAEYTWAYYDPNMDFGTLFLKICQAMVANAKPFAETIVNRLENEFKPAFRKKFLENVMKFRSSLADVAEMTCDRASSAPVYVPNDKIVQVVAGESEVKAADVPRGEQKSEDGTFISTGSLSKDMLKIMKTNAKLTVGEYAAMMNVSLADFQKQVEYQNTKGSGMCTGDGETSTCGKAGNRVKQEV